MQTDSSGALRGSCPSCPFNDGRTDEASIGQNYGCLPTPYDIVQMKRTSGQNWACHDDESKVCAGLCHHASCLALDLNEGGLVRYSSWYRDGEAAAIEEARTGYLLQELSAPHFDAAHEGVGSGDTRQHPTHRTPQLRYWAPENPLQRIHRTVDTRVAFAASTRPERDSTTGRELRTFVALLEVETSPWDPTELWVKYVSVDPDHQRKGLAAKLLARAIAHAKTNRQWLSVSYATPEGLEKFQAHLTRELNASGLRWKQSNS